MKQFISEKDKPSSSSLEDKKWTNLPNNHTTNSSKYSTSSIISYHPFSLSFSPVCHEVCGEEVGGGIILGKPRKY